MPVNAENTVVRLQIETKPNGSCHSPTLVTSLTSLNWSINKITSGRMKTVYLIFWKKAAISKVSASNVIFSCCVCYFHLLSGTIQIKHFIHLFTTFWHGLFGPSELPCLKISDLRKWVFPHHQCIIRIKGPTFQHRSNCANGTSKTLGAQRGAPTYSQVQGLGLPWAMLGV